jgi:hypothetical protein
LCSPIFDRAIRPPSRQPRLAEHLARIERAGGMAAHVQVLFGRENRVSITAFRLATARPEAIAAATTTIVRTFAIAVQLAASMTAPATTKMTRRGLELPGGGRGSSIEASWDYSCGRRGGARASGRAARLRAWPYPSPSRGLRPLRGGRRAIIRRHSRMAARSA